VNAFGPGTADAFRILSVLAPVSTVAVSVDPSVLLCSWKFCLWSMMLSVACDGFLWANWKAINAFKSLSSG
jgi:hypothetical protein